MILNASAENGASSDGRALDERLFLRVRIDALDRRHVERRRQVVHDRVEQRLHALVLERRAADDRRRTPSARRRDRLDHAVAQRRLDLVLGDLLAAEVLLEQLVVVLADLLDQLLAVLLRLGQHVGRDLDDVVVGAHRLVLVGDRLHLDRSMTPRNLSSAPIGSWIATGLPPSFVSICSSVALEVRADAVHLVDEADARHAVLVGLAPHRLRLRLDAGDRVEHRAPRRRARAASARLRR